MTITYSNGTSLNAVLLSRDGDMLRTAVLGEDEAREFTCVSGTWISEDCEPVEIQFGWERCNPPSIPNEADCICPKELASRLISMLLTGSQGDDRVLEDMLWVFCAEGERVRLTHGQGSAGGNANELAPSTVNPTLLN